MTNMMGTSQNFFLTVKNPHKSFKKSILCSSFSKDV
jgi:hypothetical protein